MDFEAMFITFEQKLLPLAFNLPMVLQHIYRNWSLQYQTLVDDSTRGFSQVPCFCMASNSLLCNNCLLLKEHIELPWYFLLTKASLCKMLKLSSDYLIVTLLSNKLHWKWFDFSSGFWSQFLILEQKKWPYVVRYVFCFTTYLRDQSKRNQTLGDDSL